MKKKAQVFVLEISIALFLFFSFYSMYMNLINENRNSVEGYYENQRIQSKAVFISDVIVRQGTYLNLTNDENLMNYTRFMALNSSGNYTEFRQRLGIEEYGIYIELLDDDFGFISSFGNNSRFPEKKFSIDRYVLLENRDERNISIMRVMLWE